MNLARIIILVLSVGAVAILASLLSAARDTKLAGRRLTETLQKMEAGYLEFVRHRIHLDILSPDDSARFSDNLVMEAMPVLEPYLHALIAGINGNSSRRATVNPGSGVFASVAATAEWLNQTGSGPKHPLSPEQEKQLRASVEVAVRADLLRRKMNLEEGRL
jgi:hypothetical protein